jgi:hypothetical protein
MSFSVVHSNVRASLRAFQNNRKNMGLLDESLIPLDIYNVDTKLNPLIICFTIGYHVERCVAVSRLTSDGHACVDRLSHVHLVMLDVF